MRMKHVLFAATLGAAAVSLAATPASAQPYQGYARTCAQVRANNQVGGALLGGILGGVLGSNVAAHGHRGDGTAVGAVLGGMIGSQAGGSSTNCDQPGYGPPPPPAYGSGPYPADYPPPAAYPGEPGYYPDGRYADDNRYRDYSHTRGKHGGTLYPYDSDDYKRSDDYAGRDCSEATQITRLPDGSEIRRPVEACRDAYYGDWQVRN